MQFSASQIATLLNGKLEGDPDVQVHDIAKIEQADEGTLSFIANPKYEAFLYTTRASVIIVNEGLEIEKPVSATLIRVRDAYAGFALLLEKYDQLINERKTSKTGIYQPSYIADTATLGKEVYVGPFAYIGENVTVGDYSRINPGVFLGDNVKVGSNTILHAGVKVYFDCTIGNNTIIHAGTVIGSDGFGFAPQEEGNYKKIPQIGNVKIEDNVEIGANTTIDRATIGSTVIAEGVKLDNLIQIAHNVEVGSHTVIAAQAGVSGSTKIGKNCMFGGQAGIVGHLNIADGTRINAQSGVAKSVNKPNTAITGTPAFEYKSSLRSQAIFRNLPELEKRVQKLEDLIKQFLTEKERI